MALISNFFESLYNGVNQQASEHRLSTQVEEMVNAYPTLDKGLLKRNPTKKIQLGLNVSFDKNMWSYAYDRGLAGDDEEKYSINISDGNLEIINVMTGEVYKEGYNLTFDGSAKDYLFPFSGMNGYAATTIKDTTFIVNKTKVPALLGEQDSGTTVEYHTIELQMKQPSGRYAPYSVTSRKTGEHDCDTCCPVIMYDIIVEDFHHAYTIITIDGKDIEIPSVHNYTSKCTNSCYVEDDGGFGSDYICLYTKVYPALTYASYSAKVYSTLAAELGSGYKVTYGSNNKIIVKKLDQTAITSSYNITSTGTIDKTDYIESITDATVHEVPMAGDDSYLKNGYVWLESASSASAYTYSVYIEDENGVNGSYSASDTITTSAASKLATNINNGGKFTATSSGSVVKIVSAAKLKTVDASDTYGNQASSSWIYKVQFTTDLPKNMGFDGAVVKVTGSGDNTFASFWLQYKESSWQETKDPMLVRVLDETTMPHILVRNSDGSFTIKKYGGWVGMEVGDEESNQLPSFIKGEDNNAPVIKDIFFMKNRLGFITETTTVLSEVGEYGNFWRTTTAAVLDSDPIDATIDTSTVVSLEYVVYLQDSVMLFSDKAQFRLSGGKVLSPKDVQISKTSSYEVNMNIRPIYMNDKIFFCSRRGDYTAVMEYRIREANDTVEAIDITAHVQSYIPSDITRLSGNSINNMLFLTSSSQDDTVFVYKYYDNGGTRVQSAWFKWKFNGSVYNGFSLGKNFNMLITRKQSLAAENWVLGSGIWNGSKMWDGSKLWVGSPSELTSTDQFEVMNIAPKDYNGVFLDNDDTLFETVVSLGEWVYSTGTQGKDIRGHLKVKTAMITSEEGSDFNLIVDDISRNTRRVIKSKYTVGRKPMIYGDSRNIRLHIFNLKDTGFRINSVSLEGALTKRDKRL